jgi:hypothetical protein
VGLMAVRFRERDGRSCRRSFGVKDAREGDSNRRFVFLFFQRGGRDVLISRCQDSDPNDRYGHVGYMVFYLQFVTRRTY